MYNRSARRWFSVLVILIPVLVLSYVLVTRTQETEKPKVINGMIDLSHWDFAGNGNLPLNGEWKFYWNSLLTSTQEAAMAPVTMRVPGIWNNEIVNGQKIPAEGYATYALRVQLPEAGKMYALNLLTVSNAYRLLINGKLIASNGTVGNSNETSLPEYAPRVVTFVADAAVLEILVQVSNFDHCKGGLWLPIEIGTQEHIQHDRDARVLLEMFLFGCLFIMALYHFGLYMLRRNDSTTLFFGLMCAVIGIRSLLTGDVLMNQIIPGMEWHLARKIEYLLTFTSAPIYVAFCKRLYPTEWREWIYRSIVGFGMLLCAFVLFTPTEIFTHTSYVFTGYAWITGMLTIAVFVKAFRQGLDGAGIFLATTVFFLLTIVNDTLNQLELVHTGLYLSFGLLVVIFAQSFSLSSRFSNAYFTAEIYASTFRKFVPSQFLNRIAKDGIHSIKPGNAERAEVTVLFSDIRSFTSIAEDMSPDEVFRMLNRFLSYVEPPISSGNGFVDKYMGDGIMALFENSDARRSSDYAITAALEMQEALGEYNRHRIAEGKIPLQMGVGVHTGPVIIGTLGANDRMDSTAIGDAVNLASRIEGMTKMYGVPVLASRNTLDALEDASVFRTRYIDNVMAKGKQEPVEIWQIIGRSSDPLAPAWKEMLAAYNEGMRLYRAQNVVEAKRFFELALEILPDDKVAAIYLERCVKYLATGSNDHISGVVTLEEK